ncbi:MAG TPA: ATP-binding cassette domain-containing protein [Herbaspirillum sp.]|jgi:ATP-binding cassette subfamily B protein/ATP-binding cassette subfamily C protein LapB
MSGRDPANLEPPVTPAVTGTMPPVPPVPPQGGQSAQSAPPRPDQPQEREPARDAIEESSAEAAMEQAEERDPMYLQILRAYGSRFVEIGIGGVLINSFGLLMPLYSRLIYDKVIGNHIPDTLWALTIGLLLFALLEFVLRVTRTYYIEQLAGKFDIDFDEISVQRLLNNRFSPGVGTVLAKYREINGARDVLSSNYMLIIIDFPFLLLYLVALGMIGGEIVWVVLVGGALLVASQYLAKIPAHEYAQRAIRANTAKTDKLASLVAGIDTLKTSAMQHRFVELLQTDARSAAVNQAKNRFWMSIGYTLSNSSNTLISVGTMVVGVYLVEANTISVGALIAASLLAGRAGGMMSSVSTVLTRIEIFRQAREGFEQMFLKQQEAPRVQVDREQIAGHIQVANLNFRFDAQRPETLHQISLNINPGEKVGLVGRSGSGKSTLLRCLAGVHRPDAGQALIDGLSIEAFSLDVRCRYIGYKPQESFLFEGTLESNIFIDGSVRADVRGAALAISGLDESIAKGQLRLDQVLNAASTLSGGQRQMVALARAVATLPNVLLLDEPTSGIDQATENRILQNLMAFARNRTLVIATHSPALLQHMDRIVVIEGGRIVADGPRDKILQSKQ